MVKAMISKANSSNVVLNGALCSALVNCAVVSLARNIFAGFYFAYSYFYFTSFGRMKRLDFC